MHKGRRISLSFRGAKRRGNPFLLQKHPCQSVGPVQEMRIATPVRALVRNDRGRRTAVVGSQEWVQGTASACGSINKIVPGVLPRTMPKHRDTTLLRRLLTQVGLMKCRYTSALLRAPPSEPKAQVPSTRRLRSHVPPSVPRPLSPGRALFGGLKWGTLSFIAILKSYRKISLRFSDKRV